MALATYRCEGPHCSAVLPSADVALCDQCQAKADRMTPCPVCARPFDPAEYSKVDNPICCGTEVLVGFFRGADLTDTQLAWALTHGATQTQRDLALWLRANFQPAHDNWSSQFDHPHGTDWAVTSEHRMRVEFSGAYMGRPDVNPVESIEFPNGLPVDLARSVLGLLVKADQ